MSQWEGIEEFVAIANAGSFVAAAKALDASPAHVSRAIMALERRVQAQLFIRTTRVVRLTDTGRNFLDHCRRLVQDRDEAIALVAEGGEPRGELRMTCSTAMGERFVSSIMREYARQNPGLRVTIDLTNRLTDLVAEGYDLAIRTGALADSGLIGTRIASRRFVTCAAPSYLDSHSEPQAVDDLGGHECIAGSTKIWHFTVDGRQVHHRPRARFTCNSGHAVVEACLAGMGICQLPEFFVLLYVRSGELRPILSGFQPAEEPIWAVYPQQRHLLPKIRRTIDLLRTELPRAMAMNA